MIIIILLTLQKALGNEFYSNRLKLTRLDQTRLTLESVSCVSEVCCNKLSHSIHHCRDENGKEQPFVLTKKNETAWLYNHTEYLESHPNANCTYEDDGPRDRWIYLYVDGRWFFDWDDSPLTVLEITGDYSSHCPNSVKHWMNHCATYKNSTSDCGL